VPSDNGFGLVLHSGNVIFKLDSECVKKPDEAERLMASAKQMHMCFAAQHTKLVKLPLVAAGIATGLAV
jgi:hypothetical protein